jgi:hypothetical protein
MPTDPSIPFPADLDALCVPGCLDALSAAEVGALYRLVRFAWTQEPACTLPNQPSSLAMVARVTHHEWEAMWPHLLIALDASLVDTHPTPPDGLRPAGGPTERERTAQRILLGHARRRLLSITASPSGLSAKRRAAGMAGATARWGDGGPPGAMATDGKCHRGDGKTMANATVCHRLPSFAISARSSSESSALSPSAQSSSMNQSALSLSAPNAQRARDQEVQRQGAGEIAGRLGAGRGAPDEDQRQLAVKLARWKRDQSFAILRDAWESWSAAGLTTCPLAKISELASSEHATPERMDFLVQDAHAKVRQCAASREFCNPVGMVIVGLGLVRDEKKRRVAEVPLFVVQRWADKEAAVVRILRAQVAIDRKVEAAAESAATATTLGRGRA